MEHFSRRGFLRTALSAGAAVALGSSLVRRAIAKMQGAEPIAAAAAVRRAHLDQTLRSNGVTTDYAYDSMDRLSVNFSSFSGISYKHSWSILRTGDHNGWNL
jgi:hypothetical protein